MNTHHEGYKATKSVLTNAKNLVLERFTSLHSPVDMNDMNGFRERIDIYLKPIEKSKKYSSSRDACAILYTA